jgi:hypothetical protein
MATNLTDPVPISSIQNLNSHLTSAHSSTMKLILGAQVEPLVQNACRNEQCSVLVRALLETRRITPNFRLTGIKPALDSVQRVIAAVQTAHADLISQLGTEGMLCVRHKKPTNGAFSSDPSNHSWGSAVDFKFGSGEAPGDTGKVVPRWLAILVPFFNAEGWFSGISFHDTMHFEVADETIRKWHDKGLLTPAIPVAATVAGAGHVA